MIMILKHLPVIASLAFGMALVGCDSAAENQVEQQAEAIDESYEAEAQIEESLAEGTQDEAAVDEYADNLREQGEDVKDNLEDDADEMDSTPQ